MVVGPIVVSSKTGMPVDVEEVFGGKVAPKQKITKGMTVDTDILPVSFGGFTPMALTESNVIGDGVEDAYDRMARQREEADEAKRFLEERAKHQFIGWHYINKLDTNIVVDEEAHTVSITDDAQNVWHLDMAPDGTFRVIGCDPAAVELWVPSKVGDTPVSALAADSLAYLHDVEAIYVPDTVTSIGLRSFLDCKNLRRLVLPRNVNEFTAQWTRGCVRLEELVLPGAWEKLDQSIFDTETITSLVIGPGTKEILHGCFEKSRLENVVISPENPYLKTDGNAIYSIDGSTLVVMARPVSHFDVPEGVTEIAKKAFYSMKGLESISLPASLETLRGFCFGRTGLSQVVIPENVKTIEEKAFFFCEKLESVLMGDDVEKIGDEAFSNSGLKSLVLPSAIKELGKNITLNSRVTYTGVDATFRVAPGSTLLEMDLEGGLYRNKEDGKHFSRMLEPACESYEVQEGTVAIDEGSFTGHGKIRSVTLPASVSAIRQGAFKGCRQLKECKVASTLERVEAEAFLDTALESFTIPAALTFLGTNALVTHGAHTGINPSLRKVNVQEGNPMFFMTSGMLCRRYDSGVINVILFDNSTDVVVIPPETYAISSYAFAGCTGIRSLTLPQAISSIDICGLKISGLIEHLHIDLAKPYQGHDSFDIYFPDTDRGRQGLQLALCVRDHVDMKHIFNHYDASIGNATNFDSVLGDEGLSLYDQSCRIINRLLDPVYMNSSNKLMLESFIKKDICGICVAIARRDDRVAIDGLFELGFLNEETLLPVIDRVGSLQDAAMTGYLLEAKRRLFAQDVMDFDL